MWWKKLPTGDALVADPVKLENTVFRLLFRHGALTPHMMSVYLLVPLKLIEPLVKKLEGEEKVCHVIEEGEGEKWEQWAFALTSLG